jgi:hypothetical protein
MKMSLVIAFIGTKGSIVAGDRREITLLGDSPESDQFEEELYSGQITSDEAMLRRAREFELHLGLRDTKRKVQERQGILTGEVTDFEHGILRKRRLYVTTGRYVLADKEGQSFTIIQQGSASRFVVLGNHFTQQIANRCIGERWKSGGFNEAIELVQKIMQTASRLTASVSREYDLIETTATVDLEPIIEEDRKMLGSLGSDRILL